MRTADQPIRISLFAPNGRMGQAIATAAADDQGFAIDQDHGDVLVDFSAPAALPQSLDRAISAGIPILVGTTGLDELAVRDLVAGHLPREGQSRAAFFARQLLLFASAPVGAVVITATRRGQRPLAGCN